VTEETVGQRIRRLRLARGLSQRGLSGPGVSYAYVSRIEADQRKPSLKALRYLAGKLGVDPEYLEDGRAIPAAKERELRLADAEIGLRLGGDLARAEETLRALLREDVPDGLDVRIRATLGKLLAEKGENDEALRQLERVVASGAVRPETRPDVYETLATVYAATKRSPQAIDLLEDCLAAVDEDEEALTQRVRYRSVLAQVFSSVGALERARTALEEATDLAEGLSRPQDRVALYWTGARISWMEARDADAALRFTGRAIGLLEATEDTIELARAHLLAAQIYNLERRAVEAQHHLAQAEPLLDFGDDRSSFGILRSEQAKAEAQVGNPERAVELGREAKELLAGDVRFAPNARHALALAYTAAGDVDAANAEYDGAVSGLAEREQWREAINVARDWADALRAAGRTDRAYAVLEHATDFGQRVGVAYGGSRAIEPVALAVTGRTGRRGSR
jgi:transcriptional regulator with XRE-family HTH domain